MKNALLGLGLAVGVVAGVSLGVAAPTFAQGKLQTLSALNVTTVAAGYRASKILGSAVVNDADEKIGSIDDLIVSRSDHIPYAILSVGGFLGMGDRLVAVPMTNMSFEMHRILLPGGSKEMLKALPEFKYQ